MPTNNLGAEVRLIPRKNFNEEEQRGRSMNGDWEFARQSGTPYGLARRFLRSPKGLPCNQPPWGTLTAIDSDTGEVRWTTVLGQFFGTEKIPSAEKWGSPSLGGPMITAGGLVFIGATLDGFIRAFDVTNGHEVWKAKLPSSARSMPMTYLGPDGKQYVVIAAGGHFPEITPLTDTLVAFRLKQAKGESQ
jgi:quinoprotein glucose dehydrogenase